MTQPLTKSELSDPRRQLIEWMQRLGFGTIEGLIIRDGEPVLDPAPLTVRDVKFGAENGPRPESELDDFALKAQVIDLLAHLDSLENAIIRFLEVKYGLPFRMQVEDCPVSARRTVPLDGQQSFVTRHQTDHAVEANAGVAEERSQ